MIKVSEMCAAMRAAGMETQAAIVDIAPAENSLMSR